MIEGTNKVYVACFYDVDYESEMANYCLYIMLR